MDEKKPSILEMYQKQVEIDKENENNDAPEGSFLTDDQKKQYEETLATMREDANDMEKAYFNNRKKITNVCEGDLNTNDITPKITIRHAYCPVCGEELIADAPPMYNPYTMEKMCKHTCKKCFNVFNAEYTYPRVIYLDENNNEIKAYGE